MPTPFLFASCDTPTHLYRFRIGKMSISIPNMTETWRELKLAEIQADMDQTATSLANRKDESDSSRKKLIVERNPSNLFGSINPI